MFEQSVAYCSKCGGRLTVSGSCPSCNPANLPIYPTSTLDMQQAKKRIKGATIAAIIVGCLTLIFALTGFMGYTYWELLDALLAFGLAFGISRNNRACAVIMLVYWVISKILQLTMVLSNPGGIFMWLVMAIIFGIYFFQGILGTFAYQRIQKIPKAQLSTPQ